MAKTVIKKRNYIDSGIIAELNEKYPDYSERNGVSYSRDLKYITFEPSVDFDADIVTFDMQIGFGTFNVIIYFSEQMMRSGYKVKITGNNMFRHMQMCNGMYGVEVGKVQQIIDYLININYFFRISDGRDEYLTTAQAVFDYERCMNTRFEARERKAKSREKYKKLAEINATPQPLPLPQPLAMDEICICEVQNDGYNPNDYDDFPCCDYSDEYNGDCMQYPDNGNDVYYQQAIAETNAQFGDSSIIF